MTEDLEIQLLDDNNRLGKVVRDHKGLQSHDWEDIGNDFEGKGYWGKKNNRDHLRCRVCLTHLLRGYLVDGQYLYYSTVVNCNDVLMKKACK